MTTDETPRRERRGMQHVSDVIGPVDFYAEAERLRLMQPPPPPPDPVREERERVIERRRRLRVAGVLDTQAIELIARAKMPPVVAGHDGSRAAFAAAEQFIASPQLRCLTLLGGSGTGKTYAADWILASVENGMLLQGDVYTKCDDKTWERLTARALNCDVLVVNDLGTEEYADWKAPRIASMLVARHDLGKRYVITANLLSIDLLDPSQPRVRDLVDRMRLDERGLAMRTVQGRYGDPLADRLSDARYSIVGRCVGASIRRMKS